MLPTESGRICLVDIVHSIKICLIGKCHCCGFIYYGTTGDQGLCIEWKYQGNEYRRDELRYVPLRKGDIALAY